MRNRQQLEADIETIRELLQYPADYTGECDRCHYDRPLWIDHDEPGEFAFCGKCWQHYRDDAALKLAKPESVVIA